MKIILSKNQWEFIGKKTGWIKTAETAMTYKDKNNTGKTITLSGPDPIDANVVYRATIKDWLGSVESVFQGTLGEVYLQAQEREFAMPESVKELQSANSKVVKTADSQTIVANLKNRFPLLYNFLSKTPGFGSALDIVDNIQNNKVSPENAGITPDIINQAKQIINKVKTQTASSKNIVKESFNLDARVIAAIIVVILGIALGRSVMKDAPKINAMPSQLEQVTEQLGSPSNR